MKYITLKTASGLKFLLLAKMAILGQCLYFSNSVSYEVATSFKLTRKQCSLWWFRLGPVFLTPEATIMAYFLAKMAFLVNFISLQPLIVWSRATLHFNQKSYEGSYIEVQHFENWNLLKIVGLIRRWNAYFFNIY